MAGNLDDGITLAFGFFALGILFLFICTFIFGIVEWVRELIG